MANTKKYSTVIIAIAFLFCVNDVSFAENEREATSFKDFLQRDAMSGQFRTFFMRRHFDTPQTQESMAIGGHLKYETPYWHNAGFGVAVYTAQPFIFNDSDRDGAGVLAPHQKGYTVLGEAFLKYKLGKTSAVLYRQVINTPFINASDFRMTPQTFEAYTLESKDIKNLTLTVSHVTKMKGWDKSKFIDMSEAAGISGTHKPVTMFGALFSPSENYKFQLWEYYCYDFMNIVYFQADVTRKIKDDAALLLSFQALDQQNIGEALAGEFHTGMAGVKTGLGFYGAEVNIGYTITNTNHDIINPWTSYPGYTSILDEDSDLAGERAWLLELIYDFGRIGIKGLSASLEHTESYIPHLGSFSKTNQKETDLNLEYHFSGKLKCLWMKFRCGFVENSLSTFGEDYRDYRFMVNYDF